MADEKKPTVRLGGLNAGPGAGRLGKLRGVDGARTSNAAAAVAAGGGAAGGGRKMRFMPTNFSRPKQLADSPSQGAPSTSMSAASKSESAFEDLVKAARNEGAWQQRGGRSGRGRGGGPVFTTFGGGAGEVPGGAGPSSGRCIWGGGSGSAGGGRGSRSGGGRGGDRLVKASDKGKQELEVGVKAEPVDGLDSKLEGTGDGQLGNAAGRRRWQNEDEKLEVQYEEDPISYDQYYPTMLPHRKEGELLERDPDDPAKVIPPDLFDLPEDYQLLLGQMSFLQDAELNDGRLLLFQLPSLLPVASQAAPSAQPGADGLPGTSAAGAAAAVAASRPASMREVPSSRIGKLLVFESGKVKMQIGDVLLDVDPGITPRFRQDLAVVSAPAKQCVMLSSVEMRLVCTPNLETLLEPMQPLPQWQRAEVVQAAAAGTDGLGGMPAAAGHLAAQRALVMESSEEDGAAEAMEVDGGAAAAAANGTQAHAQRQQQSNQQQQKQGKQAVGVAVKSEDEEEEVVSPRCGAMCLPRGGGASGGGGGGGGVVRSPLAGVFLPRGGQRAAEACGGIT